MTLTLAEVMTIGDSGALARLSGQEMPVAAAWRVQRLQRALVAEYQAAMVARNRMFDDQHSAPAQGPSVPEGTRLILPEYIGWFTDQMAALGSQTVEIAAEPIPLAWLDGCKLSPSDIGALEPIMAL